MGALVRARKWGVFVALALAPLLTVAQLSPQLQRALDWLTEQVQSVAVTGEAASVAAPVQVRAETVQTLRQLSTLPAPLAEAVYGHDADDADVDTETLSRRILSGATLARDLQPLLQSLQDRINPDGGLGAGPGYRSSALDTAWGLLALAQAGQAASAQATAARQYLTTQLDSDGGLMTPAGGVRPVPATRLYASALASLALQTAADGADATRRLNQYLASQQAADGGWAGDTVVTAWVLQALGANGDANLKAAASNFLQARQAGDGSWNGDPYITAVALRALTARSDTASGAQASISGTLIDATSGLPLQGASIAAALGGATPQSSASDSAGRFTLSGLAAGSYTLSFSRAGYQSATASLTLSTAQTVDLGLVRLQSASATGIVRGSIVGLDGTALPGASVQLNNGTITQAAIADGNGRYEFSAAPLGSLTLAVTLTGYQTANASAVLQGGQTLVFSPALAKLGQTSGNTGSFFGQVVKASDGTALPAASITLTNLTSGATQALSAGADGRFSQTLNPGSYSARYEASGYNPAQQQFVLTAGTNVNAGTIPLSAQLNKADLSGRVTGDDGQPIAGASVQATALGYPARGTTTDASGAYSFSALDGSSLQVRASKSGYLTREAIVAVSAGVLRQDFVLRRVAAAGIDVRIASFAADAPSVASGATAAFTAGIANAANQAQTVRVELALFDGSGQYAGAGSAINDAGVGQSEFLLPAAGSLTLPLKWTAFNVDAGAYSARLRLVDPASDTLLAEAQAPIAVQAGASLPDLTLLKVDHGAARSDAQSLAVDGRLNLTIANNGTAALNDSVSLLAFVDVNRNGRFDAGIDTPLGRLQVPLALQPKQTTTLDMPVKGQLPFRDAPIHVWIDDAQAIAESSETNNVTSTAEASQVKPAIGSFKPKLKWQWTGSTKHPDYNQVMMAPVVGRLLDTNGDGKIDAKDTPAIAFVAFNRGAGTWTTDGVLRVVRGDTGEEVLTIKDGSYPIAALSGIAIADLDGDGKPEIVATTEDYRMVVYRNDGQRWWVTPRLSPSPGYSPWGGVLVADLEGDGRPEVIFQKNVYSFDGSLKWQAAGPYCGGTAPSDVRFCLPVAADLFQQGRQDLILGGSVYSPTGQLLWQAQDGFSAVADFDRDGVPEVLVHSLGGLSLYKNNGQRLWSVNIPGGGLGGPPTVADVDGDGFPEIGVAGGAAYTVFRRNGTVLWSKASQDLSSQMTGSTVFDFDGDGASEVLYADEVVLKAFKGSSGEVLWSIPNSSGTALEFPVVADVDADNHADMVIVANDYYLPPGATVLVHGIRVFQDEGNSWVNVRSVWNQHAYSITNINDDLTVPAHPVPSWEAHNTFRANKRLDVVATAVPDATAGFIRLELGSDGRATVRARIGNAGLLALQPGLNVALYGIDAQGGSTKLAVTTTSGSLESGQYEDVAWPAAVLQGVAKLAVVADDDGTGKSAVSDFDRSNNRVEIETAGYPFGLTVGAATDRDMYAADTAVIAAAPVRNIGAASQQGQVSLTVLAPDGRTLSELGSFATGAIAAGGMVNVNALWNTGATLAGAGYKLRATLLNAQGQVVNTAEAPFAIVGAGGQSVSARITTDRAKYALNDNVKLDERVANLTSNSVLEGLTAHTEVRDPYGVLVWEHREPLAQLVGGADKSLSYSLPLTEARAGRYSATLTLLNALGAAQASSATVFEVGDSAVSGAGLSGTLAAVPGEVSAGDAVAFTWSVRNEGNADLNGLPLSVRILDPQAGQQAGELNDSVNLPQGQSLQKAQSWTTQQAQAGKTLVAALTAQVGGTSVTLAQDTFSVVEVPIKLTLGVGPKAEARVLALVSCPPGDDTAKPDEPSCLAQRVQALDATLTALGVVHKITTTKEQFETELRCGHYNTYWISGGSQKLTDPLVKEVRAAVQRGDGLVLDGVHDSRNQLLHPAAGVQQQGKLAGVDQVIELLGTEVYPAGSLGTLGRPTVFAIDSAQVEARFTVSVGNQQLAPALLTNRYGQGKSVLFAFDLVQMLVAKPDDASQQELVRRALAHLANQEQPLVVGSTAVQEMEVYNDGNQAADVWVQASLPAGVRYLSASAEATGPQPDAQGQVNWRFKLEAQQRRQLQLRVTIEQAGAIDIPVAVQGAKVGSGQYKLYADTHYGLNAQSTGQVVQDAIAAIQALVPAAQSQVNAKGKALQAAQSAQGLMSQAKYADALLAWVNAADELLRIDDGEATDAARTAVAKALESTERALCRQLGLY